MRERRLTRCARGVNLDVELEYDLGFVDKYIFISFHAEEVADKVTIVITGRLSS